MKSCLWLCVLALGTGDWVLPEDHDLYEEVFHRATSGTEAEREVNLQGLPLCWEVISTYLELSMILRVFFYPRYLTR